MMDERQARELLATLLEASHALTQASDQLADELDLHNLVIDGRPAAEGLAMLAGMIDHARDELAKRFGVEVD